MDITVSSGQEDVELSDEFADPFCCVSARQGTNTFREKPLSVGDLQTSSIRPAIIRDFRPELFAPIDGVKPGSFAELEKTELPIP